MAATDVALTDEHRCRNCGHPKADLCPCTCCAADAEALLDELEFAAIAEADAAEAIREGDYELAGYLLDVADYWGGEPDEGTRVMRFALLNAALARNEG